MPKKESKPAELRPWDRRPWPKRGDQDKDKLYAAVGRFLSHWENYEGFLSILFSTFVAGEETKPARRAYTAVRTFEGRAEMLKAASTAYFESHSNDAAQQHFKRILVDALGFGPRRNDIAHGQVDIFAPQGMRVPAVTTDITHALYPSHASFKDRSLEHMPAYCYTSAELDYFDNQITRLSGDVCSLGERL